MIPNDGFVSSSFQLWLWFAEAPWMKVEQDPPKSDGDLEGA